MPLAVSNPNELSPPAEIAEIHQRCGVYTKSEVVESLLAAIGWSIHSDLTAARLLEPAAGDGRFVAAAAQILCAALAARGLRLDERHEATIVAYEFHRPAAAAARRRVAEALRGCGVAPSLARGLAKAWVRCDDFLLSLSAGPYTHAVGNPPYVRWSKVPPGLRKRYEAALSPEAIGGDLFLPFLDHAFTQLAPNGAFGFVCSDRWRFMGFAEGFRRKWLPRLDLASETPVAASDAFERDAGAYASMVVGRVRQADSPAQAPRRSGVLTLSEAGYRIRVGPALGCTTAFVLAADEHDVEPELLVQWIPPCDIREGAITWSGRRVVAMHDAEGRLISPTDHPGLERRLLRHREALSTRSIVARGAPWYRPIDRVRAVDWTRPKLLVPELAKTPRLALDLSGAVPAHGVYAIFAPDDNLDPLLARLHDGGLAKALDGSAPKVSGGYIRCYGRFLSALPAP